VEMLVGVDDRWEKDGNDGGCGYDDGIYYDGDGNNQQVSHNSPCMQELWYSSACVLYDCNRCTRTSAQESKLS